MKKRVRGDALLEEHTGSASMVNLDGQGKNVFNKEPVSGHKDAKKRAMKKPLDKRSDQD